MKITRRRALIQFGVGAAGLMLVRPALFAKSSPTDLSELAKQILRTPRDSIFELAATIIAAGASRADILGASFLAGIHDVRPRHVGGKLHCVMVIESMFDLATVTDKEDAWLLALWALDDLKRSQERDTRDGDWSLPLRPAVTFASETVARREFHAAMNDWDDERADRAITGLIPFHDHASIFEILWPYGARSFVDIGHKIIYTTQVERALRRIGWQHAEPTLRSLVYGLLHTDRGGRATDAYKVSLANRASLPADWLDDHGDSARSMELLVEFRDLSMRDAQTWVVGAIGEGISSRTILDTFRLRAAELFLQRSSSWPPGRGAALLPVHAVTETEAFGYVFSTTTNDHTRRMVLLQAAGWLSQLREGLVSRNVVDLGSRGMGDLNPEPTSGGIEELLSDPSPESSLAYLQQAGADADHYLRRLVRHLAMTGEEHHQHKYAAALAIESRRIHPRWRTRLLASAVPYMHHPRATQTRVAKRGRQALEQAGVL